MALRATVGRVRPPLQPFGPGFVHRRRGTRSLTPEERAAKREAQERAKERKFIGGQQKAARRARAIGAAITARQQLTKEQLDAIEGGAGTERETLGQAKTRRIKEQTAAETARQARSRLIREGRQEQVQRRLRKRGKGRREPSISVQFKKGGEKLKLTGAATAAFAGAPLTPAEAETKRRIEAGGAALRTADEPRQEAARRARAQKRATGGRQERFVTEAENIRSIEAGAGRIAGTTVPFGPRGAEVVRGQRERRQAGFGPRAATKGAREAVEGTGALEAALNQVRPGTPEDQAAAGGLPTPTGAPTPTAAPPVTPQPTQPAPVQPAAPPADRVPQAGPLPTAPLGPPPTGFVPFNAFPDFSGAPQPQVTPAPALPTPLVGPQGPIGASALSVFPATSIAPNVTAALPQATPPAAAPVSAPLSNVIAAPPGADRNTRRAFALRRMQERAFDFAGQPVQVLNAALLQEFRDEIGEFPELAPSADTGERPRIAATATTPAQVAEPPTPSFGQTFSATQRVSDFRPVTPQGAAGGVIVPAPGITPETAAAIAESRARTGFIGAQTETERLLAGGGGVSPPGTAAALEALTIPTIDEATVSMLRSPGAFITGGGFQPNREFLARPQAILTAFESMIEQTEATQPGQRVGIARRIMGRANFQQLPDLIAKLRENGQSKQAGILEQFRQRVVQIAAQGATTQPPSPSQ